MAATFADVVADCQDFLYSHGSLRDSYTTLQGNIGSSDTTLVVADPSQIKGGYLEIDDELLQISGGDSQGNVTVFGWGRGARGTTAASHSTGAKVTVNPQIATTQIKKAIAESVSVLYPTLFQVLVDQTNTYSPVQLGYPLPAAAAAVAEVSYQVIGPALVWKPITRWKFVPKADTTTFPTGKAVEIYGQAFPGRVLKITYRADFGAFVNSTDTFGSIGLKDDWRDLVRLDSCARLITSLDSARLQLTTIEAAGRAEGQVQPLQALQVAKSLRADYATRMAAERRQLLTDYPATQQRLM